MAPVASINERVPLRATIRSGIKSAYSSEAACPPPPSSRSPATYAADPIHSSFSFAVRYMGVSTFRGTLGDVSATLTAGADGVALEGAAEVESISIRTPQQFRDHVLSADFFDVANHPQVAFRSTRVELTDDGRAVVDGELTIKGVTQPVHAEGGWSPEAETLSGRSADLTLEDDDRPHRVRRELERRPAGRRQGARERRHADGRAGAVAAQPEEA